MPCLIKMQLPCFMQCASIGECWCGNDDIQLKMYCNCHVCCTAIAMYVVMHLPCVVYCICHVQRNIFAMFNELCLPCSNKMYFYFHDNIRCYKKRAHDSLTENTQNLQIPGRNKACQHVHGFPGGRTYVQGVFYFGHVRFRT